MIAEHKAREVTSAEGERAGVLCTCGWSHFVPRDTPPELRALEVRRAWRRYADHLPRQ